MGYTSTDLASYVGATILWTILSSFIVLYVWKKFGQYLQSFEWRSSKFCDF
jgi:hypothetical protein